MCKKLLCVLLFVSLMLANKMNYIRLLLLSFSLLITQTVFAATKQLYLENLGGVASLTRVQPTANTAANINSANSITISQSLPMQAPFTISANGIAVNLTLQRVGGGSRTAQVELFLNGVGGTSLGTDTWSWASGGANPHSFIINNASAINMVAGDYLTLVVSNTGTGRFRVRQAAGGESHIALQTDTVITIDEVGIHSNPYPDPEEFLSYTASSTVYLRATVSDPFGYADISSVDFTVNDPNSPPSVFTANIVTPEPGAAGATAVFETAYTLPPVPAPDGVWSVDYVANEGSEGTVTSVASKTFGVGSPALNVSKSSFTAYDPVNMTTAAKSIPNSIVEYTVEVTNSGFGYVDENSVIITDVLPSAQSTFYFGVPVDPVRFIDGSVSSGLSFTFTAIDSTTDDVDFSNDGCLTYVANPTADPVTGYDTTSPKINCIAINPKGSLSGSDGTNHPSFSVTFSIKVD